MLISPSEEISVNACAIKEEITYIEVKVKIKGNVKETPYFIQIRILYNFKLQNNRAFLDLHQLISKIPQVYLRD